MRLIVFSEDSAPRLHTFLASVRVNLPSVRPEILVTCTNQESIDAYCLLIGRAPSLTYPAAIWHEVTDLRRTLADCMATTWTQSGEADSMVMFATDQNILTKRVILTDAIEALRDPNTLGLSLTNSAYFSPARSWESVFVEQKPSQYVWDWANEPSEWGDRFSWGTIYRHSDIIGPVFRNTWDTPDQLRIALNGDSTLSRRTRMACLKFRSMGWQPESTPSIQRYLNGEVLDYSNGEVNWVPYKEE